MRILTILLCFFLWAGTAFCAEEEALPKIEYLPLESNLIVNLQGRKHYLRAEIQLMIRGTENIERIRSHIPAVRHTLIMLFSAYTHDQLAAVEERQTLQNKALEEIKATLDQYSLSDGLEGVLFTEFLAQ